MAAAYTRSCGTTSKIGRKSCVGGALDPFSGSLHVRSSLASGVRRLLDCKGSAPMPRCSPRPQEMRSAFPGDVLMMLASPGEPPAISVEEASDVDRDMTPGCGQIALAAPGCVLDIGL